MYAGVERSLNLESIWRMVDCEVETPAKNKLAPNECLRWPGSSPKEQTRQKSYLSRRLDGIGSVFVPPRRRYVGWFSYGNGPVFPICLRLGSWRWPMSHDDVDFYLPMSGTLHFVCSPRKTVTSRFSSFQWTHYWTFFSKHESPTNNFTASILQDSYRVSSCEGRRRTA